MRELPTGTLTFLFTDIEGSTSLLQDLADDYPAAQAAHDGIVGNAIADSNGVLVRMEGDSFFAVFVSPSDAVRAAATAQLRLAEHSWPQGRSFRVRMGLHTGDGVLGGGDYVGIDVNRAARIATAAWGGQVLLSEATATLVRGKLPTEAAIRSVGTHRLKDLDRAEELYDLVIHGLDSAFPPPRTLEVPSNLPTELTSFVGRTQELDRVKGFLAANRLVTVTGPGGTGKTRLALRVGREVSSDFPDGTFFVDLAPVTDPVLVVPAIASSMMLREEGWERPVSESLKSHLQDRRLLLILDNFEQVIDAAPVTTDLLESAPALKILVTSRAALRVRGEQDVPLMPLAVPSNGSPVALDELISNEAVALFVERATAVAPDFALSNQNAPHVAHIVARLDGLPLAIELAASRAAVLGPRALLTRLEQRLPMLTGGPRDVPARQQTLRAAIGWSYELLSTDERVLFRRLAVLMGGSTVEAAEAICDPDGDLKMNVLDGLSHLVEHSLVYTIETPDGSTRFGMLQTVREFGAERLETEDDAHTIRRRHAEWFLRLAEAAEPQFRGPDLDQWLTALDVEHDNLRAALRWAIENEDADIGLRLAGALWRFWHLGGYISEGRLWVDAILSLEGAVARTRARARALTAAGGLAYWQHDAPTVRGTYEEALAISRELGDEVGIAEGTYNLAFVFVLEEGRETAEKLYQESLEMFEHLGNDRGAADALSFLSECARWEGNVTHARDQAERGLRIHRAIGDVFGLMDSLHSLGRAALDLGDLDTARSCFLESLDVLAPLGYRTLVAVMLDNFAAEALKRGLPSRAVRLAAAAEGLKEAAGGRAPPEFMDLPDPREVTASVLTDEEITAAWEEGRAMDLDAAVAYARVEPDEIDAGPVVTTTS